MAVGFMFLFAVLLMLRMRAALLRAKVRALRFGT
jgi:hypothetical protein